ncbi:PDZ domain-containing protein [Opitutus terrae]|uniref:PDZ domain-containing protein n=1 Tax=Opitutus terrae TaxID=107709 RepID=UPI0002DFDAA9|nr:PDZ domain-containing protein [Opitutus terrae]
MKKVAGLLLWFVAVAPFLRAADLPALWAERVRCVVAVEYYVETEIERRPSVAYGTVIDDQGTIILPSVAVSPRTTPAQLKEFKVYRPGNPEPAPGEYLGQDALTGWHFVRAASAVRGDLVPITRFAAAGAKAPAIAEEVWGIGLRGKDEDFLPYLLTSRIALVQALPQRTAIAQQEVAGPGLPAFNRNGDFVGLAASSFGQNYVQFSRDDRGGLPVILVNVEESGALLVAAEVLPYLQRIPQNVFGRPLAWLGAYGLEPVDPEVASFLKLGAQSALVISEVLEGSPAEIGGLKDRDILLAIDGQPLPRFKPDRVVVGYVGREIQRRRPGDAITFTVLRGGARVDARIVLGEQPKLFSEAERKYFDRLGLTIREFVYDDAVARRARTSDAAGVIAHFVKPNGPAAVAGLRTDDWIKEIDGTEVKTFAAAATQLGTIEADRFRTECVLLVSRGGETAVLRVKL